ncbi:multiple C2 and transmembrane domain-containing protein 1 isoform X3 [Hydra vulgaris]|uniref:Multiple C2 and transmembrane domain-containing protein 1 isoform X3 n=1 Tax=Hydra vulgaris TaxID=6087 RepID=A0ABM4DE85_HYDVU
MENSECESKDSVSMSSTDSLKKKHGHFFKKIFRKAKDKKSKSMFDLSQNNEHRNHTSSMTAINQLVHIDFPHLVASAISADLDSKENSENDESYDKCSRNSFAGELEEYDKENDQDNENKSNEELTVASVFNSAAYSSFLVEGEIVSGSGLIARDSTGKSDPYVKVKLNSKNIYKTKIVYRNLDPQWRESFSLYVENVDSDLIFKVYDFDRILYDDYMGECKVSLGSLKVNKEYDMQLPLINLSGLEEQLGFIRVKLSVIPKSPREKFEQLPLTRGAKTNSKCNISDSVLSVTLREGKNLKPVTHAGYCDVFVRFKLGVDKYKSRVSKHTNNPVWNEQFDMKLMMSGAFSCLEASVWDKESGKEVFIGRGKIDISTLTAEKTHDIELNLEDQPGVLYLYLCITGLNVPGCISDLTTREEDQSLIAKQESNFSLWKTVENFKQIGWMQIKVHRANGLAVADLGGASDPFAIIELANQRLVTPTIYKTLNPQWEKVYELIIYDIHDALEITIFDEDKRGPPEFLGRVKIPLLSIKSGEKCVYQLRDKRLQTFSKGNLIMTATIFYNSIRASLRTFTPKEIKVTGEAPKFRRQLLQENVNRVTNLIQSIIATSEFIQSLFTWKYKLRSGFAFLIYILFVWNFDWFMLPLILFLALLKNYVILILSPTNQNYDEYKGDNDDDDDDDEENEDKSKKGKSKTFREKWEAINHICTLVQNHLNNIASFGERIKNTFAWTVPFLSFLLMVILLLATIVLYIVPLRYLLLLWGINKFTKKIRKPHAIANNEFLDFLSRVPSDPEVKQFHQHLGAPLS